MNQETRQFPERPQLPLTTRKKAFVGVGAAMFAAQLAIAVFVAPAVTGEGDANAGALAALWACSVAWSITAVLLLVRQTDMPDIATAAFLLTIPAFGAFTLVAALDARGTESETNLVSALFLGVTAGALTALIVWPVAQVIARVLKLPTTEGMHGDQ
jgi:hypothetical protein